MTPPDASFTIPEIAPEPLCASAGAGTRATTTTVMMMAVRIRDNLNENIADSSKRFKVAVDLAVVDLRGGVVISLEAPPARYTRTDNTGRW
jgi:hypothetical protein